MSVTITRGGRVYCQCRLSAYFANHLIRYSRAQHGSDCRFARACELFHAGLEYVSGLKRELAIKIFKSCRGLKRKAYWGNHFWSGGYFVTTLGEAEDVLRRYVNLQIKQGIQNVVQSQMERLPNDPVLNHLVMPKESMINYNALYEK